MPSDLNPLKRIDTDFVDDNVSTTTPDTSEEEEQLPMNTHDAFWLFDSSNTKGIKALNTGKWMLFYPNDNMNEIWKFAKEMYKEGNLTGVNSMKCSTAIENPSKFYQQRHHHLVFVLLGRRTIYHKSRAKRFSDLWLPSDVHI